MSRNEKSDDKRRGVAIYLAGGLLFTVVCGLLVLIALQSLFDWWLEPHKTEMDFTGNGLSYLALGVMFLVPIFNLLVLAAVFMIAVPWTYAKHRRSGAGAIRVGRWILSACGIVAVLYAVLLTSWFWRPLFLMMGGPVLVVMAPALWAILTRANADLRLAELAR